MDRLIRLDVSAGYRASRDAGMRVTAMASKGQSDPRVDTALQAVRDGTDEKSARRSRRPFLESFLAADGMILFLLRLDAGAETLDFLEHVADQRSIFAD